MMIIARLYAFNFSCINILLILQIYGIIYRTKRLIVEHLSTLNHQMLSTILQVFLAGFQFLQSHNSLATFLHSHEVNHGRGLERIVFQRLHRHLREERERTFTAHHRMGNDVERIVIGHKGTKIQARHILDSILFLNAVGQFLIRTHFIAQFLYAVEECGMRLTELLTTLLIAGIQNGSIRKHYTCREHHAVAVGMHTAVHARGIINHNTTHHGRTNRSRIGREHAAVWFQYLVDSCTYDSWLKTY